MAKLVDIQGRFPCEPDNKKPTLIKKWEYSTALYPPNNAFTSDNTFTLVTTDTFMLGIYELGPGGVFAPLDIHPGDESYYILNGPVVQRSGNGQFAYLETGEGAGFGGNEYTSEAAQRLLNEAARYLGTPYVWGGYSPSGFDCSGFVSYCLTHSGVRNTGRLTAQGLYDICTPVSQSEAQPGDLIFFTGTYDAGVPVTHIGIYVGNGQMIHCGHPVQYTSINSPYWQSHFYGFGRW